MLKQLLAMFCLMDDQGVIYKSLSKVGVGGSAKGFDLKLIHEQVGNKRVDGGSHGCTMYLFIIFSLEEEVSIFKTELQQGDYLLD